LCDETERSVKKGEGGKVRGEKFYNDRNLQSVLRESRKLVGEGSGKGGGKKGEEKKGGGGQASYLLIPVPRGRREKNHLLV